MGCHACRPHGTTLPGARTLLSALGARKRPLPGDLVVHVAPSFSPSISLRGSTGRARQSRGLHSPRRLREPMSTLLTRDEILALLDALAADLRGRGHHGDLFLVGGAAMALAYDTRRATRDLDAVFEPKQVVY